MMSASQSQFEQHSSELESRRTSLLRRFQELQGRKQGLVAREEGRSGRVEVLTQRLDRIRERRETLGKHDVEIEKASKMLEEAFRTMGEEKEGVIVVSREAERKLKVLQEEYEVLPDSFLPPTGAGAEGGEGFPRKERGRAGDQTWPVQATDAALTGGGCHRCHRCHRCQAWVRFSLFGGCCNGSWDCKVCFG